MEKENEKYSIAFRALADGDYNYEFAVDDEFFLLREDSLVNGGDLTASVRMRKTQEMLRLDLIIKGIVKATCDVCLDPMDYEVSTEGKMVVELADADEEVSEELVRVGPATDKIYLDQWIYEMIAVVLPIRFEHPLDAEGNSTCNREMLAELDKYLVDEKTMKERKGDEVDPRWAALKDIKLD